MFFNIIYSVVVSIIIIFVIHNIFEYFKSTLTTPKVKDLINKPKSEYDRINRIINSSENSSSTSINELPNISDFITDNDRQNTTYSNSNSNHYDPDNIKSELKDFFKQLNSEKTDNEDIFTGIDKRDFDPPQMTPAFSGFQ